MTYLIARQLTKAEIPFVEPEVFRAEEETAFAYDAEEVCGNIGGRVGNDEDVPPITADNATDAGRLSPAGRNGAAAVFSDQPPEKMEEVLNTGIAFIGRLLEMATG